MCIRNGWGQCFGDRAEYCHTYTANRAKTQLDEFPEALDGLDDLEAYFRDKELTKERIDPIVDFIVRVAKTNSLALRLLFETEYLDLLFSRDVDSHFPHGDDDDSDLSQHYDILFDLSRYVSTLVSYEVVNMIYNT
jgi:hypothetical protein